MERDLDIDLEPGRSAFNRGDYFGAHELWEDVWPIRRRRTCPRTGPNPNRRRASLCEATATATSCLFASKGVREALTGRFGCNGSSAPRPTGPLCDAPDCRARGAGPNVDRPPDLHLVARRKVATKTSRFIRRIDPAGIAFGQASWHAPMLLQPPNPSASAWLTMAMARAWRSGWPCGNRPRWAILAAVNRAADPFGQAAAHAPHPTHAAASIDASASDLGIAIVFASTALPVGVLTYPPAAMIRSRAARSTIRSRTTGNACPRQGSSHSSWPS